MARSFVYCGSYFTGYDNEGIAYYYDKITDCMYIRRDALYGAFTPMVKADGTYLTHTEWVKARKKRKNL